MNLKQIARSHTTHDGAVTWWLMPYSTLKMQATVRELARMIPKDQWRNEQTAFIAFEGLVCDLEFKRELTPELNSLRAYWTERPASLAERHEAFMLLFSDTLMDALFDAFNATRETVIEATDTDDPEVLTAAVT